MKQVIPLLAIALIVVFFGETGAAMARDKLKHNGSYGGQRGSEEHTVVGRGQEHADHLQQQRYTHVERQDGQSRKQKKQRRASKKTDKRYRYVQGDRHYDSRHRTYAYPHRHFGSRQNTHVYPHRYFDDRHSAYVHPHRKFDRRHRADSNLSHDQRRNGFASRYDRRQNGIVIRDRRQYQTWSHDDRRDRAIFSRRHNNELSGDSFGP